jgi:hypothetical protein
MTSELEVNRANTAFFISQNPIDLVLTPRTKLKDAYGERWVDGTPRDEQTFRLIDQSGVDRPVPGVIPTAPEGGRQRKVEFLLLGRYDSAVELFDTWTDSKGVRWEIDELLPFNGYEVRATAVRFGER